ncbi:alpha/beta hydrolase [Variovorax terrae]|uniref:Alpha/beta hydrolase n=1 Tax=Variovorax terrae TaxID=2923278 RepID=A0A9X1VRI5_9BURK|nr:alpha/beta hydrolase [Variovorax terrae]MCJ0761610.1 alpha/beta hydrolase [Variovorax terrae]
MSAREKKPMRTDVKINSAGLVLAGHLYTPEGDANGPRPAIVVSHPASGVKEQTAGLYAQRLAGLGFVALTFDAAYQGESEGMPRGTEDPAHRVEDIKAAVSFLSGHDAVYPDRIGALGICASGGYVISAASVDHRIKAVATISGVDIARQFRHGPDGTQSPAVIQTMLDAAAKARTAEVRGEGVGMFPIFPANEEQARAGGRHVFEGWEYYCSDRAQHPRSAKAFTWNSVDRLAAFDAFRFIDLLSPRPLLMIVGTEAVTKWMASEAFIAAREPKEVFWIEGATHVSLYDKDEHVSAAVSKLRPFFAANLSSGLAPQPVVW